MKFPAVHSKQTGKVWPESFALVDAKSFYTSNLEAYVGVQPEGPYMVSNTPSEAVTWMIAPISRTGRNVAIGNWFTGYPLAKSLSVRS
jgi:hypothetical protein